MLYFDSFDGEFICDLNKKSKYLIKKKFYKDMLVGYNIYCFKGKRFLLETKSTKKKAKKFLRKLKKRVKTEDKMLNKFYKDFYNNYENNVVEF